VWTLRKITERMTVTIPGHKPHTFIPAGVTDLDTGQVTIDPGMACWSVRQVVVHEAVHVNQGLIYGSGRAADIALAPYGGVEVNAECARGYLTGSTVMSGYKIVLPCKDAQLRAGIATATGRRV
jgi:hypothetical protein